MTQIVFIITGMLICLYGIFISTGKKIIVNKLLEKFLVYSLSWINLAVSSYKEGKWEFLSVIIFYVVIARLCRLIE